MSKIAILLSATGERSTRDVGSLALNELLVLQPQAETLLRDVRKRIGLALRAERDARALSLNDVSKLSRGKIDAAGVSRLERGEAWSESLVTRLRVVLSSQHVKTERASATSAAR